MWQLCFCCTWPILFLCALREACSCGNFFSGLFPQWYACFHFLSTLTTDTSHEKSAILFQQKRLLWTNDLQIDPATLLKALKWMFSEMWKRNLRNYLDMQSFYLLERQAQKIFDTEFSPKNLRYFTPVKQLHSLFFPKNLELVVFQLKYAEEMKSFKLSLEFLKVLFRETF